MPFIIIAALLFGGALAWKMLGDKEEVVVEKTTKDTVKVAETKKIDKPTIAIKKYEPTEKLTTNLTVEERAEAKKISQNFLKFAMRYKTKESVEEALNTYKANGDSEKYHYLALFAEDHYPELEIPSFD